MKEGFHEADRTRDDRITYLLHHASIVLQAHLYLNYFSFPTHPLLLKFSLDGEPRLLFESQRDGLSFSYTPSRALASGVPRTRRTQCATRSKALLHPPI